MITGYQFDNVRVDASKDAALYHVLAERRDFIVPGIGKELKVTAAVDKLELTVATGMALIQGRLVEVTSPEKISVRPNQTGKLVIEIDLSKANTPTGDVGSADYRVDVQQVGIKVVRDVIKNNLMNGGHRYHYVLGDVTAREDRVLFITAERSSTNGKELQAALEFLVDDIAKERRKNSDLEEKHRALEQSHNALRESTKEEVAEFVIDFLRFRLYKVGKLVTVSVGLAQDKTTKLSYQGLTDGIIPESFRPIHVINGKLGNLVIRKPTNLNKYLVHDMDRESNDIALFFPDGTVYVQLYNSYYNEGAQITGNCSWEVAE